MDVSGVMRPSQLETGLHMSLEPTPIPRETPLSRSDGTQSGLAVPFPRLSQPLASKLSALVQVAMVLLAQLTLRSMAQVVLPALIKPPEQVAQASVLLLFLRDKPPM